LHFESYNLYGSPSQREEDARIAGNQARKGKDKIKLCVYR
jgi:hypothetical protein